MDHDALNHIIWQLVAAIPKGKVATYGQIAKLAGHPHHARYVGLTLKKLPKRTQLPWHRVVNARGKSAFPPGSDKYQQQMVLLKDEGIIVHNQKIRLSVYGWQAN